MNQCPICGEIPKIVDCCFQTGFTDGRRVTCERCGIQTKICDGKATAIKKWDEDCEAGAFEIRKRIADLKRDLAAKDDNIRDLTERVLAVEAREKGLRDALEKLARLGNEPHYGNSIGNEIAKQALKEG